MSISGCNKATMRSSAVSAVTEIQYIWLFSVEPADLKNGTSPPVCSPFLLPFPLLFFNVFFLFYRLLVQHPFKTCWSGMGRLLGLLSLADAS